MAFIQKKPKTIMLSDYSPSVPEPITVNVHEGTELETVKQVQRILNKATPAELATLDRLFDNPSKRKNAMNLAAKYL